jgi:hypothetical protein
MKTSNKISIRNLEFLPLILIVIYKMAIQTNASISHRDKMAVMYVFIAISTIIFGYLLLYKKSNIFFRILSLTLLIVMIFLSCYLIYFKK